MLNRTTLCKYLKLSRSLILTLALTFHYSESLFAKTDKSIKDKDLIMPSYSQIDYPSEVALDFSWGTAFIKSVTSLQEHGLLKNDPTTLHIRHTCGKIKSNLKKIKSKTYTFCRYSESIEDLEQKQKIFAEMEIDKNYKTMSPDEKNSFYIQNYNFRKIDPKANIMAKTLNGKNVLEIKVHLTDKQSQECRPEAALLTYDVTCP